MGAWRRLEKLWALIEPHVARFGAFRAQGPGGDNVVAKQSGVLRVNCIDCLDRTNVVQGWLARRQLDALLADLRLLPAGSSIREAFPEVPARAVCSDRISFPAPAQTSWYHMMAVPKCHVNR